MPGLMLSVCCYLSFYLEALPCAEPRILIWELQLTSFTGLVSLGFDVVTFWLLSKLNYSSGHMRYE